MALEDALILAKSLCGEASPKMALRRYEALRRERTCHVQKCSLLKGQIGQWENRVMSAGRGVVTSMLPAKWFERNLRNTYSYVT
jgi:2-polyprenyl-6-methoxyphenol hydroxylase-like FAD-dependent oxidoreductase